MIGYASRVVLLNGYVGAEIMVGDAGADDIEYIPMPT
jgi:hypothetical protein